MCIEHPLRRGGADARDQMHQPETGDAVARIFDKAQQRQHVLDMGGIEEFQAAEFDEGDVAPGQFDLQRPAVAGGAEQHGLLLQTACRISRFSRMLLDDAAGLVGLVADD